MASAPVIDLHGNPSLRRGTLILQEMAAHESQERRERRAVAHGGSYWDDALPVVLSRLSMNPYGFEAHKDGVDKEVHSNEEESEAQLSRAVSEEPTRSKVHRASDKEQPTQRWFPRWGISLSGQAPLPLPCNLQTARIRAATMRKCHFALEQASDCPEEFMAL